MEQQKSDKTVFYIKRLCPENDVIRPKHLVEDNNYTTKVTNLVQALNNIIISVKKGLRVCIICFDGEIEEDFIDVLKKLKSENNGSRIVLDLNEEAQDSSADMYCFYEVGNNISDILRAMKNCVKNHTSKLPQNEVRLNAIIELLRNGGYLKEKCQEGLFGCEEEMRNVFPMVQNNCLEQEIVLIIKLPESQFAFFQEKKYFFPPEIEYVVLAQKESSILKETILKLNENLSKSQEEISILKEIILKSNEDPSRLQEVISKLEKGKDSQLEENLKMQYTNLTSGNLKLEEIPIRSGVRESINNNVRGEHARGSDDIKEKTESFKEKNSDYIYKNDREEVR